MRARAALLPAWSPAVVLAAIWLLADWRTGDIAAQLARADLFARVGWTPWESGWYGGHHVPAYSVLSPALGAWLGPRTAGALAAVAAAVCFDGMVRAAGLGTEAGRRVGSLWFALCIPAAFLLTGRLAFALGAALALGAGWAAAAGRRWIAVLLAALSGLGSPVAAAFLALGAAAVVLARLLDEERRETRLAALRASATPVLMIPAALVPPALVAVAFPEGGDFPFAPLALWPAFLATALVCAVVPSRHRVLAVAGVLYLVALVGAGLVPTALGGNATRPGALLAGPLLACVAWDARRRAFLLLAPLLLYWAWYPAARDMARAAGDPSLQPGFYRPLVAELKRREGTRPLRVEVPFTAGRMETYHLPRAGITLARGWERQVDRDVNALFYDDGGLDPARYDRWLHDAAVRYVALPVGIPLDFSAKAERRIVAARPRFLREVWRSADWRLFAVRRPRPIAPGATRLTPDRLDLVARRPGRLDVRLRWTPYWRVEAGAACVAPGPGGWTRLTVARPGPVTLHAVFSVGRVRARSPRCAGVADVHVR